MNRELFWESISLIKDHKQTAHTQLFLFDLLFNLTCSSSFPENEMSVCVVCVFEFYNTISIKCTSLSYVDKCKDNVILHIAYGINHYMWHTSKFQKILAISMTINNIWNSDN